MDQRIRRQIIQQSSKSHGCLVVYRSIVEQQDEVRQLQETLSLEEAQETAIGLFKILRPKVERFMIVVFEKSEPGPMVWIFDARTYGMRIRFTTPVAELADWGGDKVTYQQIHIGLNDLANMLHGSAKEIWCQECLQARNP